LGLLDTAATGVTAHRDLILKTVKEKLFQAAYKVIADAVNSNWTSHPKNPNIAKPVIQDTTPTLGS
jgi:hypothetical protein